MNDAFHSTRLSHYQCRYFIGFHNVERFSSELRWRYRFGTGCHDFRNYRGADIKASIQSAAQVTIGEEPQQSLVVIGYGGHS